MGKKDDIKYVFVVLGTTVNPKTAIKTILFEQKIMPKDGLISLYAPYNKLLTSYKQHFGDVGMWGVGFSLAAFNANKQIWDYGSHIGLLEDDGLKYCQINIDTLNFSALNRKDYFFVAPKLREWEEIWFDGFKPGTKYKQWWCKGLHESCNCKKEQDITDYLDEKKNPFFWKNYKEPKNDEIFPQRNLVDEYGVLSHDYSLLKLSPKELHEGGNKVADITGQMLF